ncbi:hypothetical protein ACX5K5_05010 [Glutamicibacter bergerei]|jgi:hypothetical protein|uniref:Uncharacterized protein n=2 Tax=Glutamicibacter TaxID=1742989 RepID=A0ABV9MN99_9MICC|nr:MULTISPECIES: hypothetical protein [Glutamicibacter]GGJ57490.1 hypothetical protein GCM10007173_15400 [Glutamicibacter ardleyensis]
MIWAILLMALGAFLAGGAISLQRQKAHLSWIIALWALAAAAIVAGWVQTL